jgi:uncharacterized protein YoaH (UPF0181 family)
MADNYLDDEDDLSKFDRGDSFEEDEDEEVEEDEDTVEEDEEETEEDESEEDDDSGESEEDEEEEEAPPVKPRKDIRVPKSRLDEVIAQREDAKERMLWLESQLERLIENQTKAQAAPAPAPEPTYDFEEAESKYITLIIEGEVEKAARLKSEIDKARKAEMLALVKEVRESATAESATATTKALENEKFNLTVTTLQSKYSFLDADHKSYNQEAVETVNTLMAGYIASGKPKSEALKLAASKVAPMYEKTPKPALGNQRTVGATKKAVDASKRQPSKVVSTKGVPNIDTSKINISKLSDRDLDKLSIKELRALRGD